VVTAEDAHITSNANYSARLGELAVKYYQPLAEVDPEKYMPALAKSWLLLSERRNEMGQRREAIAALREAAELWQRLAEKDPNAYLLDSACASENLVKMLLRAGRVQEGIEYVEKAVQACELLAQRDPRTYLSGLLSLLGNLASLLNDSGHMAAARELDQRTLRYRQLDVEACSPEDIAKLQLVAALHALPDGEDAGFTGSADDGAEVGQ
jgi:tetratricopeptide (TPR) repeat protein